LDNNKLIPPQYKTF